MRSINPSLFARIMRLPEAARADLLEFLGASPVSDAYLAEIIENLADRFRADRKSGGAGVH